MQEDIIIELIKGVYHADDKIVEKEDTVKITTTENVSFKIVVPNEDGFFYKEDDNGQPLKIISGTVNSSNPLPLGTVTDKGRNTKYYTIDPAVDAPPRIIRVTSGSV